MYLGKFHKISQGDITNISNLLKGIIPEKVFVFHNNVSRDAYSTLADSPMELEIVRQVDSGPRQTSKLREVDQHPGEEVFSLSVRCPNGRLLDAHALWITGKGFVYQHDKSERSRCKGILEGVYHDIAIMGTPPRVIYRDLQQIFSLLLDTSTLLNTYQLCDFISI